MLTAERLLNTCAKVIDDNDVNLNTKAKYIDIAAKMLGAYTENRNIKGEMATTVNYDFGDDEE